MNALETAVLEWLAGERGGCDRHLMLCEIGRLAKHSRLWPVASDRSWDAAIKSLVDQGLIVEKNGKLKLEPKEKTAPSQMELF